MFKQIKKLSLVASMLLLAACSNSSNDAKTDGNSGEIDRSQTIVIYTNSASNGRSEYLQEKAEEAGYKLQIVDIAGSEIADRLIAEKNNAVADLVFGPNTLEFERIKKEELLVKYSPKWADKVDSSLGDKDGYYHSLVVQPLVLIGNKTVEMPSDWVDLTKSSYKDKYGILNLGSGTSKIIFSSIVSRYPDKDGELGISEEGWKVAKDYLQNAHIYADGEDFISAIIDDENDLNYSMIWGSGVLQNESERNYKFQVMSPEVGVPYVTEQIGILNTSEKQALLKEFVDWFGSAEVQKAWSDEFGSIPANQDALAEVKPDIKEFVDSVKPQKLDWEFIGNNVDSWIEKAQLEFIQ
ncbi:extracellular solute-binding protein [Streptococcus zalophi]|uniref:extracellular solute-binding protein n=1 Tax=Streptococcus zalophi TaxID=640031 RepID=UPI00215CF1F6|nr:extracellular solute-binding protein [Streptococcus zalophi]MCR8968337.1 extracellular solute-binding protein [Streptococcus zalophi]